MNVVGIVCFIGGPEILLIFLVILLLFGSKRIPDFAKMMGKGMREFKKASEDIKRQINDETSDVNKEVNDIKDSLNEKEKK